MIQSNNAALLAGNMDISGLSDGFRDGQKLRQEYEARQQQKALNEIMRIEDHAGRIAAAQQHKYAGALVPQLQQYDEARQKAALDNLKTSADIGKTFGETGKLGAETGKIGAETGGQLIKNTGDTQNQISALAVTRSPQIFALGIGEMVKRKIIEPERANMMIQMVMKDPENASKVLENMVMANPELAKLFQPKTQVTDTGDQLLYQNIDGFTGQYGAPYQQVKKGESPDNYGTRTSGENNNIRTTNASMYSSDNSLEGQKYSSNNTYNASVYGTDVASRDRGLKLDQDGKIAGFNYDIAKQNANTNETNAKTNQIKAASGTVGANGQPVRKLSSTEQKRLFEISDQLSADKLVLGTLEQMLGLVNNSYSGVGASGRAKGMSNIGLGGAKADNTVLYDNLATSQALAQLKATFGAAPTEGERKILMDIQASANKTPQQKIAIIRTAVKAVRTRAAHRQAEKNGIQTGQYMVPTAPAATKPKAKPQNSKGASIIGGILGGG